MWKARRPRWPLRWEQHGVLRRMASSAPVVWRHDRDKAQAMEVVPMTNPELRFEASGGDHA